MLTNTSGGASLYVSGVTGNVGTNPTTPTSVVTITSVGNGSVGNMQSYGVQFNVTAKIDNGSGGSGNTLTIVGTPPAGYVVGLGAGVTSSTGFPIILAQTGGTTGGVGTYTISGPAQFLAQQSLTIFEDFILGPQISGTPGGPGTYHADNWYQPYAFYDLNTSWPAGGSGWGEYATFTNWGTSGPATQGGLMEIGRPVTGPFTANNNYIDMTALDVPFKALGGGPYMLGGYTATGNIDMAGTRTSADMNPAPF